MAPTPRTTSAQPFSLRMWIIRYGIGVVMVLGGIATLIISPAGMGVDGFAMAVGGGLGVLLLNWLYRLGVSGDEERARHEAAWHYFEEHGEWPDEPPPARREWTLPAGVVTAEAEAEATATAGEAAAAQGGTQHVLG
jgi:hypothetical protein